MRSLFSDPSLLSEQSKSAASGHNSTQSRLCMPRAKSSTEEEENDAGEHACLGESRRERQRRVAGTKARAEKKSTQR